MSVSRADLIWLREDYVTLSGIVEGDRAVGAAEHAECQAERDRAERIVNALLDGERVEP